MGKKSRDLVVTEHERREIYMKKTREEASYLFKYLIFTQMVVYFEAGAIPCLLDQLSVDLQMDARQQGALGGVVYLTLSFASPLCAYFLHRFNPKHILGITLLMNNFSLLMLALTPTGYTWSATMMICARASIGFSQAFPCVYMPLWVDEYAPREKVAGWMSYLQGSVPMGVMLGYFLGTISNWIIPRDFEVLQSWRWPFLAQFVLMCPSMIAIFFVPKQYLIIRSEKHILTTDATILNEEIHVEEMEHGMHDHEKNGEPLTLEDLKGNDTTSKVTTGTANPIFSRDRNEERSSFIGKFEDSRLLIPPLSRSGLSTHRHDEEDVLLASAGMYGISSQRSFRQLLHNAKHHHHLQSVANYEDDLANSKPSLTPPYNPNDSSPNSAMPPHNQRTSITSAGYGTIAEHGERTSSISSLSDNLRYDRFESSYYEEEFIEVYEQGNFSDGIHELAQNPIFVLIVLGLTAVYFVVTGVQYWSTIFMIKSLHGTTYVVNSLFVVVAGTGPILGVFFGGWIIDKYGGYIGVIQRAKALGICMILGVQAFAVAVMTTFFNDIYITAGFLWLLLFFGGSILPACTGIFISVVPAHHRALASSVSVTVFNLIGYSLSPYLTGLVMGWILAHKGKQGSYFEFCDEACAYRLGFRFCICWSIWSIICIGYAWRIAIWEAAIARELEQQREAEAAEEWRLMMEDANAGQQMNVNVRNAEVK